MRVYRKDEAWAQLSRGAGQPVVTLRPQHRGAGFPRPGPQTAAEDQPGREKPPRLDGGEQITVPLLNLSNFSSPPGKTSLRSSHSVSALHRTPRLQPESFSDRTDSATHWSILSFRQQPISTLSAHPNYNCTVRRLNGYLKKPQTGRTSNSIWALQDCRAATTNAL